MSRTALRGSGADDDGKVREQQSSAKARLFRRRTNPERRGEIVPAISSKGARLATEHRSLADRYIALFTWLVGGHLGGGGLADVALAELRMRQISSAQRSRTGRI